VNTGGMDITDPSEAAIGILAGARFAGDFTAVREWMRPKSKLRLAFLRGARNLIEHELPRVMLDPDALGEADRQAYEEIRHSIVESYGAAIRSSPYEPPRELLEAIAERALEKGAYASASDALEHLGSRNKRAGDLTAEAVRELRSAAGSPEALRSAARAAILASRIRNPLGPLFQRRAVDFHFQNMKAREEYLRALVERQIDGALGMGMEYLLEDRSVVDAVRGVLTRTGDRKAFFRELALVLSGGEGPFQEFLDRYGKSVQALGSLGGERPDPAAIQGALSGGAPVEDGLDLLRQLAVSHPVSALVCRTLLVPRQGRFVIPTVVEGNSAAKLLGLVE
jgi:hypothetical protein